MERVAGYPTINIIFSHPFTIAIDPLQKKVLDLATEGHLAKFRGKQIVMRTSI
jgi:hypothetical protein